MAGVMTILTNRCFAKSFAGQNHEHDQLMRRPLRIAPPVFLLALAAVVLWEVLRLKEPVYHGNMPIETQ